MQVDLYQTLKSINVTDDQAKLVVVSIEEYIDDMVGDVTPPATRRRGNINLPIEGIWIGHSSSLMAKH